MTKQTSGEVSQDSNIIDTGQGFNITLVDEDALDEDDETTESGSEPSNDETTPAEEATSQKDDTQVPDKNTEADTAEDSEAGSKVDANASKVINSLGEDKKVFAQKLIDLAKQSDVNKDVVTDLIKSRPDVEKYFKTKFGEDYDHIFKTPSGDANEPASLDVEKIREEERAKARADILFEELARVQEREIENFAVKKAFTPEEKVALEKYVKLLGAEEDFDETLLEKAGLIVNADKTKTKSLPAMVTQSDGTATQAAQQAKANNTSYDATDPNIQALANRLGKTAETLVKELQSVDDMKNEDETYTFKLN